MTDEAKITAGEPYIETRETADLETEIRHVRETNAMLWGEIHKMEDLAKQLEAKIAELEAELDQAWNGNP